MFIHSVWPPFLFFLSFVSPSSSTLCVVLWLCVQTRCVCVCVCFCPLARPLLSAQQAREAGWAGMMDRGLDQLGLGGGTWKWVGLFWLGCCCCLVYFSFHIDFMHGAERPSAHTSCQLHLWFRLIFIGLGQGEHYLYMFILLYHPGPMIQ